MQSEAFNNTHSSIVVGPITSHLLASQIMIDKVTAIKRERIARVIGRVREERMQEVNDALRLWLHLA